MKSSTLLALTGAVAVFLTACGSEQPKPIVAPAKSDHPVLEHKMKNEENAPKAEEAAAPVGPQAANDEAAPMMSPPPADAGEGSMPPADGDAPVTP